MPSTGRRCRGTRPTSRTPNGWRTCCGTAGTRASCIPPAPIRALRELARYRQTLTAERTQEVNRLHKLLESANRKLGAVATDILGRSGRAMLEAILSGEQRPETVADTVADVARGRLRAKLPQLRQALDGRVPPQHRVPIRQVLTPLDFLEGQLAQLANDLEDLRRPCAEAVALR